METSPRLPGDSVLEGASKLGVSLLLAAALVDAGCRLACASDIVLTERAQTTLFGAELRVLSPPEGSRETRISRTGASKPLHRRSHICTLPSRLELARTFELPGWKQTCLTEETWPARV